MTQYCDIWVEIEMYHLVLFFNYVIIIKATTIWIRTAIFPPSNA